MKADFVVGLPFSENLKEIVFIRKTHPPVLAGLLNGPGGGVRECDKDSKDTMIHEFETETGVLTTRSEWRYVGKIDIAENKVVEVFCACGDHLMAATTTPQKDPEKDENIEILSVEDLVKRNDLAPGIIEMVEKSKYILTPDSQRLEL